MKQLYRPALRLVCAFALALLASSCVILTMEENNSSSELLDLKPGVPSDLSVAQLIAKMNDATDPDGVYRKAKTYEMIQTTEALDSKEWTSFSTEILYKAPGLIRQINKKNGKPFTAILYRFGKAWNIDPATNTATEIPEGTALTMVQAFMSMVNPSMNYTDVFRNVDLDVCTKAGERYYRMICRTDDPDIAPYIVYVDTKTFLTKRFETVMYGNDGSASLYVGIPEEYVWFGRVRQAKRTYISLNGKTDIVKIVSFQLNPRVDDSIFDLPKKN